MDEQILPDLSGATSREIAEEIVRILDRKGGANLCLYHVEDDTVLTDYYIIAGGRSSTHVRALADDIDYEMGRRSVHARGMEGHDAGAWVLIDFYQVIVHIFDPVSRDYYHLERLLKEENRIDIQTILTDGDVAGNGKENGNEI